MRPVRPYLTISRFTRDASAPRSASAPRRSARVPALIRPATRQFWLRTCVLHIFLAGLVILAIEVDVDNERRFAQGVTAILRHFLAPARPGGPPPFGTAGSVGRSSE